MKFPDHESIGWRHRKLTQICSSDLSPYHRVLSVWCTAKLASAQRLRNPACFSLLRRTPDAPVELVSVAQGV